MTKQTQALQAAKTLPILALQQRINELKTEEVKMELNMAVQKGAKDVHGSAKKRREIAQLKTLVTLKERMVSAK